MHAHRPLHAAVTCMIAYGPRSAPSDCMRRVGPWLALSTL